MIIYKITNLKNNKIYIGKTIHDTDDYFGSGLLISRSIIKYGKENFTKEIIDSAASLDELNEKEKKWISYFDSTNFEIGYNISKGGNGGDLFSNNPNKENIRRKCSKPGNKNGMFGRNHTEETKKKISENKKGQRKGIPSWNKGLTKKDYSPEYRQKVENQKRNPNDKTRKTYIVFSPNRELYTIHGELQKFCENNNFGYTTFLWYKNKGIIEYPKKKLSESRLNIVGWEIRSLEYHQSIL